MTATTRKWLLFVGLPIALSGCAAKNNLVVVLPDADGHVGAVVVRDESGERVLDQAYAAAGGRSGAGPLKSVDVDQQEVATIFETALSARPIPPKSFTLYFISDSDQLADESIADFEEVFAEVARRPAAEVVVTGHTDTYAPEEYNDRLSLRRAKAVRERLVERGIPADSVFAAGRGERELLVPTDDETREAKNRRVEVTVR